MKRIKILKTFFIFLLFLSFLLLSNFAVIQTFFMATLTFNVAILTMFVIGLIVIYQAALKLIMLSGTFGTLAHKQGKSLIFYLKGIDKVLPGTISEMFEKRSKNGLLYFTSAEAHNITEWLGEEFHNQKSYTSFFVGTSLMLGLFGTFTGLLVAIDEMGAIILSFGGDDMDMGEIMTSFAGPLGGMAIGFASSLFGVGSAIILNIMQYILTRNQVIFMHDIEDWLKGKIIETQELEVQDKIVSSGNFPIQHSTSNKNINMSPGQGFSDGFINVFVSKMSELSERIHSSNEVSNGMYTLLNEQLTKKSLSGEKEVLLFENMLNNLRELNVNQFSSTSIMEESLNEISNVIIAEHSTIKQSIEAQAEHNKKLIDLIQALNNKIDNISSSKA
ncbi:MAG: hypothetical protein COA66_10050 [Arcobacter sp.]|nr:MAG: hypothetical protein COA66_10050 [Arcobacter sp.]